MKKWMKNFGGYLRHTMPYWISGTILVGACIVFAIRLVDWQIVKGDEFVDQSNRTRIATVQMEAARGEILDTEGTPLAANRTAYKIIFERPYMLEETKNDTINTLVKLLDSKGEEWIDSLPIVLGEDGQYAFAEDMEDEIAKLKGKDFLNLNPYATAEMCMNQLIKRYDCDTDKYSMEEIRDILSVRYSMTLADFSTSNPYTFAQGMSRETIAIVQENSQTLPGVSVQVTTVREYPDGLIAPHLIGSMGVISQEEYNVLKDKGYSFNDHLGKNGVEGAFEDQLRGAAGSQVIETDKNGKVISSNVTQTPVQGNTVFTTLDSNLQKVANNSLAKNVKDAQAAGVQKSKSTGKENQGEDCTAGGVVVLRVKDFAVLAASTYPSYDLGLSTTDSKYYSSLLQDETKPLFNRAFSGAFMPGSSFKPVVAAAALQEGVIDDSTTVTCTGRYEYYSPSYRPKCLGVHGTTDLTRAMAKSCNIFFYDAGRNLGIKNIDAYAKSFGLGVKTGIELSESEGTLASEENRVNAGGVWNPGDVIQAAIGQSDNAFTPLQLATYCATIANNGTRLQTHMISKITNYTRDKVVMENNPESPNVMGTVNVSQENLKKVQSAMRAVCTTGGTAASVFSNYGVAIAGKTGTAENPPHSDNVVFIGYAPYDKPEIAVAVVLEYGATGRYAMNVAKDIFDAYFFGKTTDEQGNITMPSAADSMNGLTIGAQAVE